MEEYHPIAETNENTVLATYQPVERTAATYQSEGALEAEFLRMLQEQGYVYLPLHSEEELIANLRVQVEKLNGITFTEGEWRRFFGNVLALGSEGIKEKSKRIQEDPVVAFVRDDGMSRNIMLLDKVFPQNNALQVVNQYVLGKAEGARRDNRYDVTILVNGLPMVHVELKRRGVPIREAFNQIERYQRDSFWAGSGLFEYVQIFVISNGTDTKYYANSTRDNAIREGIARGKGKKTSNSFEFTSFWADAQNHVIPDLVDFTRTFFARHTLLNILAKYCIFTSEEMLMVMRPYQIAATERMLEVIRAAGHRRVMGSKEAGGYVWHTTGSGKTLTSFKAAQLASQLEEIDRVLFVVDRKDLDYQTMKEYDRFKKGAANSNTSTRVLTEQLSGKKARIIITTIQKLSTFIKKNPAHPVYQERVVLIFDECHRSQFGEMHASVVKRFKKYHLFGFTGTPIFKPNATTRTTEDVFGACLHRYTIVDAINDKNVLPFRVDYLKTMEVKPDASDKLVEGIDRSGAYAAPDRIRKVTAYILEHFNQKTCRGEPGYDFKALTNIKSVASHAHGKVEEKRETRKLNGFNAIFCVSSVEMAKLYYQAFKLAQEAVPEAKRLKVATIFSCGANEAEPEGILEDENCESTTGLDQTSLDFLEGAIQDYNKLFNTNYSTEAERFQNYYKDVSLRMKNRELDLLIVVNMFLTGFDATTLNTLWVDKNLKMHGLIQAFSRTNRILNSVKTFGNVVCFRNLQEEVDAAIGLFGDKQAGGVVLLRAFEDYFRGYTDEKGVYHKGYTELIQRLQTEFPVGQPIVGETQQKEFIKLMGQVLRMRNILTSFDAFEAVDPLPIRDLQDYLGTYQDLRDEWKREGTINEEICSDIIFEIELIRQIEINIDYILMLVQQYHDTNCEDKEILASIRRSIDASPDLRAKKDLIEEFLAETRERADVRAEWDVFYAQEFTKTLDTLIKEEHLKERETWRYMEDVFRDDEVKTTGTALDNLLPALRLFGQPAGQPSERTAKKEGVIARICEIFERFRGLGKLPTYDEKRATSALPSADEVAEKLLPANPNIPKADRYKDAYKDVDEDLDMVAEGDPQKDNPQP